MGIKLIDPIVKNITLKLSSKMGGETVVNQTIRLEDILNEKQIHKIVKEYVNEDSWELVDSWVRPASEGIAGFLGDHLKMTLDVRVTGSVRRIQLFVKKIPTGNKPKAEFIDKSNFYRREMVMFQIFGRMPTGPIPWCPKALLCNETTLVLPDLNVEGYSPRPQQQYFDLTHVLVTAASLARFHACFANYETSKSISSRKPYNFLEEYHTILEDPTFFNSPWLRAAAKLDANLLNIYSLKYKNLIPNLEEKMVKLYIEACGDLTEYKGTLNVALHKDLWVNNIMFRYENGVPVNALLIDFQCIRYGPPAFDLMVFLYLTTSKCFREQHETHVMQYYYSVFSESLDEFTKQRLKDLSYDRKEFLKWCEKSRMFGILESLCIFPYALMEPVAAQKTFDDPDTYEKYLVEDRTEPVVAYCEQCPVYKDRQLEAIEEFVERYILNRP